MRIAIIGAGIGGTSAAIALRRAGHEVELYERAPEPREVGAGISLWANALRVLGELGALDGILARSEKATVAAVRNAKGDDLVRIPIESIERHLDVPAIVLIHRAELLAELVSHLPTGTARFGRTCSGLEHLSAGARVHFAEGGSVEADLVIGADGIHSVARSQLIADGPPRYAGYTCWRGVCELPDTVHPAGHVYEIWGHGARAGVTRIGRGRVYWWVTINSPPGGKDSDARSHLSSQLATWAPPVPQMVEATPPDQIFRNDIIDRIPRRGWSRGRITLLGDAAHPTTPNFGQGGCMAIEDGIVLAACLSRPEGVESALSLYERVRFARTAGVTKESWRLGAAGQWSWPPLCEARDLTMRLMPGAVMASRLIRVMRYSSVAEADRIRSR